MPSSKRAASGTVLAAGVLAIIGSVLALMGFVIGAAGIHSIRNSPEEIPFSDAMARAAMIGLVFLSVIAAFGICTGVGLIRLKNWARISAIGWAAVLVILSVTCILMFLLVPLPVSPGTPAEVQRWSQAFLIGTYGGVLAIGIWWLILFNHKKTVALFLPSAESLSTDSPEFFQNTQPKPRLPIPILLAAIYFLLPGLGIFFVFMRPPLILFGHMLIGVPGALGYIGVCLLSVAAGLGLITLKPWGYTLAIAWEIFMLANGVVSLLDRNYSATVQKFMATMNYPIDGSAPSYSFLFSRAYAGMALVIPTIILVLLLCYRRPFMKAVEAKALSGR